jgi:hypothetical protein
MPMLDVDGVGLAYDDQPRPPGPDSPVATTAVQDLRCGEYSTSLQTGFPPSEIARYIAQAQSTPRKVAMGCFAAMRRFDVLDRAG